MIKNLLFADNLHAVENAGGGNGPGADEGADAEAQRQRWDGQPGKV